MAKLIMGKYCKTWGSLSPFWCVEKSHLVALMRAQTKYQTDFYHSDTYLLSFFYQGWY